MKLVWLVAPSGRGSLMQEECCWGQYSTQTPSLALHSITYLRRALGADTVYICWPLDATIGRRAMVFSWVFGDLLEAAARQCSVLIANPSSAADAIRRRFPAATVIPASAVFDPRGPLDYSPLLSWPHRFDRVLYQTTSGCRWRCPYCVWDHPLQRREPHVAAAEIARLLEIVPEARQRDVSILCNEITGDPDWLFRFCRALPPGVSWRTDANIRNATRKDFELAKLYGLTEVTLGVEALDDELLRTCHKGHGVEDALRVFRWLQHLGIRYRFALRQRIGETPEQLDRQIVVLGRMDAEGLRPAWITIGPMDAWPGSRWAATLSHGSPAYPRHVRPWAEPQEEVVARWRTIADIVSRLTPRPPAAPGPRE